MGRHWGWIAVGTVMRLCAVVALLGALAAPVRAEDPFTTPADYAIIIDAETGIPLYEKNADELMAPASMSKLMTLLLVFERLENGELTMDDEILISEDAWRRGGAPSESSTMYAPVNSRVPLRDLLRGIIVQSGNDACIAIAEHIAGSEEQFAALMTARARELGLDNSIFANATGWPDPAHLATPRELALIARRIIQQFPQYYPIFSETEFTWNGITQRNRNPLLHVFPGADGMKTGHTQASGYGLVGSAERNGQRFIVVFNGLDSQRQRASEARRLMGIAFGAYERQDLFAPGQTVAQASVYGGDTETVPLVIQSEVTAFVHKGSRRDVRASVTYQDPLIAPVAQGQEIGVMTVTIPGQADIVLPVFASASVEELDFFGGLVLWGTNKALGNEEPVPAPKTVGVDR